MVERWLADVEDEDPDLFPRVGELVWQLTSPKLPSYVAWDLGIDPRVDRRRVADRELTALATQHPKVATKLAEFFDFIDPGVHHRTVWEVVYPLGRVLGGVAGFRPDVASVLVRTLAEPIGWPKRQAAATGLQERFRKPTPSVVAVLVELLDHPHWAVRTAAVECLGKAEPPTPLVARKLASLLGDRQLEVVVPRTLEKLLKAHPGLFAVLPAVLRTNLYEDIGAWYPGDPWGLRGAIRALALQPEPVHSRLLSMIYGDEPMRQFVLYLLSTSRKRGYQNQPLGVVLANLLEQGLLEQGLFPEFAPIRERIERLAALLNGALPAEIAAS